MRLEAIDREDKSASQPIGKADETQPRFDKF
jgi:hypothetical protein